MVLTYVQVFRLEILVNSLWTFFIEQFTKELMDCSRNVREHQMAQDSLWLIHEHHLLEWLMNSSCHKDTTFTWTAYELFMWMWSLCGLNYSWTIQIVLMN